MSAANYARCKQCETKLIYIGENESPEQIYCQQCFKQFQAETERYKTAMRKCIKSMEGSNCLELKWLEQAVKGE